VTRTRALVILSVSLPIWFVACACDRTPNGTDSTPSTSFSALATSEPAALPSASVAPVDAASPERRLSQQVAGRVLEIARGESPSVRIAAERGDVLIKGVDGEIFGWRRGDRILVDADKRGADVIDCSDASNCSLGLEAGGDIVFSDVDAAAASRLMGMLKLRVVVAGPSRRASVEIRAGGEELLIRSFAAATGLGFKRHRGLVLFAPPKLLAEMKIKRVIGKSRRVDLQLVHAELGGFMKLLGDVAKTPVSGAIDGEISVAAREIDSADVLDVAVGLCGIQTKKSRSGLELLGSGTACKQRAAEPRCPRREGTQARAVHDSLRCIAPEKLRALAVATPKAGRAVALLGEGEPVGDEIAVVEGDYLGQSEKVSTAKGDYEINWRVSHIAHDHVELYLGVDPNVGIDVKERRIRIPVATSAPAE